MAVSLLPMSAEQQGHAIIADCGIESLRIGGSLYKVAPLHAKCVPLMNAQVDGKPVEPIAWTFERADGGKSFYTSLGHEKEFEQECFVRLLENAIQWGLNH